MTATDRSNQARRAAELAARASYGRLVALLSARSGDIAGAEDALSEAFAAALATWPERGVPELPEAWLLTTARHSLSRGWRHHEVREAAGSALLQLELAGQRALPEDTEAWTTVDQLERAVGLTEDEAVRAFLLERLEALRGAPLRA